MEYAPGGFLADRVEDSGPLSEGEWRQMGTEIASALAAAHDAGVIHCDVKPSNVLFAADGSARLADFGIAKATGMTTGTLDSIEGSLAYVPPELLDGEKPQPANDVYSLALTLMYAASGEQPFPTDLTIPQLIASIQAGRTSVGLDDLSAAPEITRVMVEAFSSQPGRRPSSSQLGAILSQSAHESNAKNESATSSRRIATPLLVVAMVAVIGVIGALLVGASRASPVVSDPPFDLCAEYADYTSARSNLIYKVSEDLEQDQTLREVAEGMLNSYPTEFARLASSFLMRLASEGVIEGEATVSQLKAMGQADNLREFGGGRPFVFDGESGSFDPAALPVELHEPARMFSEANTIAADRCPGIDPDLAPAEARMTSAIVSSLSNPQFTEGFFSDPRSGEVLDPATANLMATFAWDFFEGLLVAHWDWFFDVLDANEPLRRSLSVDHPELLIMGAATDSALLERLQRQAWRVDLIAGYERATPAYRAGLWELFPAEMELLDLGDR